MKRLAVFIALILLIATAKWPLSASAVADTLSLTPSATTVTQGNNFSVDVHEDSGTDAINGTQANLVYPSSLLKVVSATAGAAWTQVQNNTSTAGSIVFAAFPSPPGATLTGDQVVYTVVFQAIGAGVASIGFSCNVNASTCPNGNAITRASDNTNILSSTSGTSVTVTAIDQLTSGQTLSAGQNLISQNVGYKLAMQTDGNLVLYGKNLKPLWATYTNGTGANHVVMQTDGNLVVYTAANKAVWASGTPGQGASSLHMQDDGNLVVYNASNVPTWNSGTSGSPVYTYFGSDKLNNTQTLQLGRYLRAADGNHALLLQVDGNLVLYGPGYHVLWATYTNGLGVSYMVMQADGNLVIYTAANKPVWASDTPGRGASNAVMQTDGNFVVYAGATPTFATGTAGKI